MGVGYEDLRFTGTEHLENKKCFREAQEHSEGEDDSGGNGEDDLASTDDLIKKLEGLKINKTKDAKTQPECELYPKGPMSQQRHLPVGRQNAQPYQNVQSGPRFLSHPGINQPSVSQQGDQCFSDLAFLLSGSGSAGQRSDYNALAHQQIIYTRANAFPPSVAVTNALQTNIPGSSSHIANCVVNKADKNSHLESKVSYHGHQWQQTHQHLHHQQQQLQTTQQQQQTLQQQQQQQQKQKDKLGTQEKHQHVTKQFVYGMNTDCQVWSKMALKDSEPMDDIDGHIHQHIDGHIDADFLPDLDLKELDKNDLELDASWDCYFSEISNPSAITATEKKDIYMDAQATVSNSGGQEVRSSPSNLFEQAKTQFVPSVGYRSPSGSSLSNPSPGYHDQALSPNMRSPQSQLSCGGASVSSVSQSPFSPESVYSPTSCSDIGSVAESSPHGKDLIHSSSHNHLIYNPSPDRMDEVPSNCGTSTASVKSLSPSNSDSSFSNDGMDTPMVVPGYNTGAPLGPPFLGSGWIEEQLEQEEEKVDGIVIDFEGDSIMHSCVIADLKPMVFEMVVKILESLNVLPLIINAKNKMGRTPLFLAVLANNKEMTECLLKYNADPNVQGKVVGISDEYDMRAPLHLVAEKGDKYIDMLETLLKCKDINVDIKSETDRLTPIQLAFNAHCQDPSRRPKLNCSETIKTLVEYGADVAAMDERSSKSLVMMAIDTRDVDLVKMFIKCVSQEKIREILNATTRSGDTPLHFACGARLCRDKKLRIIRFLVHMGANTDEPNNIKETPQSYTTNDVWRDVWPRK